MRSMPSLRARQLPGELHPRRSKAGSCIPQGTEIFTLWYPCGMRSPMKSYMQPPMRPPMQPPMQSPMQLTMRRPMQPPMRQGGCLSSSGPISMQCVATLLLLTLSGRAGGGKLPGNNQSWSFTVHLVSSLHLSLAIGLNTAWQLPLAACAHSPAAVAAALLICTAPTLCEKLPLA